MHYETQLDILKNLKGRRFNKLKVENIGETVSIRKGERTGTASATAERGLQSTTVGYFTMRFIRADARGDRGGRRGFM